MTVGISTWLNKNEIKKRNAFISCSSVTAGWISIRSLQRTVITPGNQKQRHTRYRTPLIYCSTARIQRQGSQQCGLKTATTVSLITAIAPIPDPGWTSFHCVLESGPWKLESSSTEQLNSIHWRRHCSWKSGCSRACALQFPSRTVTNTSRLHSLNREQNGTPLIYRGAPCVQITCLSRELV